MPEPMARYELDRGAGYLSLHQNGRLGAEAASQTSAAGAQLADVPDDQLAADLSKLGQLKYQAMNYPEAEALLRRSLEIRERTLGPEDFGLVESLTNLAAVYVVCGELDAAEPLLQRVLSLSEARFGPENPEVAICLNNLARLYLRQHAGAKAEPLLLRLLEIKRSEGGDDPEVATVLASLAAVRSGLGQHDAAEQLWRRALSIRECTLAPNHFATAASLEHLADACAAQGKLEEALALLERALDMREKALGAAHPNLAATRAKIADLQLLASQELSASGLPQLFMTPQPSEPGKWRFEPPGGSGPRSPLDSPPSLPELRRPTPAQPRRLTPAKSLRELELEAKSVREVEPEDESLREGVWERDPTQEEAETVAAVPAPPAEGCYVPGYTVLVPPPHESLDSTDLPEADTAWLDRESQARRQPGRDFAASAAAGFTSIRQKVTAAAVPVARRIRPAAVMATAAVLAVLLVLSVTNRGGTKGVSAPSRAAVVAATSGDVQPAPMLPALPPVREVAPPATTQSSPPVASAKAQPAEVAKPQSASPDAAELAGPAAEPRLPAVKSTLAGDVVSAIESSAVARVDSAARVLRVDAPVFDSKQPMPTADFKPPVLAAGSPMPTYPTALLSTAVEGQVLAEFVVQPSGRAHMGTFRELESDHPLFTKAVRQALPRMRFTPAEVGGRAVPQRLVMPFKFARTK